MRKIVIFSDSRSNKTPKWMKRLQIIDSTTITLFSSLLLMVMQKGLKRQWSFSGLATMVRITLMYYVDFLSLFNNSEKVKKNGKSLSSMVESAKAMTLLGESSPLRSENVAGISGYFS